MSCSVPDSMAESEIRSLTMSIRCEAESLACVSGTSRSGVSGRCSASWSEPSSPLSGVRSSCEIDARKSCARPREGAEGGGWGGGSWGEGLLGAGARPVQEMVLNVMDTARKRK